MVSYLSEKGGLLGMDISDEMGKQFRSRFKEFTNVSFLKQRIDQPFEFTETFDKAFISFVMHGFPLLSPLRHSDQRDLFSWQGKIDGDNHP